MRKEDGKKISQSCKISMKLSKPRSILNKIEKWKKYLVIATKFPRNFFKFFRSNNPLGNLILILKKEIIKKFDRGEVFHHFNNLKRFDDSTTISIDSKKFFRSKIRKFDFKRIY